MRTILLLSVISFAACGASASERGAESSVTAPTAASAHGVIKAIRKNGAVLVIAHEEIPGVMPAMTMPFRVDEKARRNDLATGDKIEFWVVERDGLYAIVRIERA
ncbi:MAG: copper-binding protein [Polyangiales bacterium]